MPTQVQAIAAGEFLADFQKRGLEALWDFRAAHPGEGMRAEP